MHWYIYYIKYFFHTGEDQQFSNQLCNRLFGDDHFYGKKGASLI